jgi:two-component system response regulator FixJ
MTPTRPHAPPDTPLQVFLVEDDPSVCTAYERLMLSAHHLPRSFPSIEALLAADLPGDHACVVSDVRLPGASGWDLPALLRRSGHPLPVILVSAERDTGNAARARTAGAADFLRKPVDAALLLEAISRATAAPAADTLDPRPAFPSTEPDPTS